MNTSIRDQWLWNRTPLRIFVSAIVLVSIALSIACHSIWLLFISSGGLLFWLIYWPVGRKVERLYDSLSQENGEPAESLIVIGLLQSPGVCLLKDDELVLAPIVGTHTLIPLESISRIREVVWFNGSLLWWKKGFWLTVPGRERLGFAVAYRTAKRWREKLIIKTTNIPGIEE